MEAADRFADLPEPARVGKHLRYYGAEDRRLCGGTLAYMSGYLGELVAIHEISEAVIVDYYHLSADETASLCQTGVACTTWEGVVATPIAPHEHELVHAVRSRVGRSQAFVEEGLAEVWGSHRDRDPDYFYSAVDGARAAAEDRWENGYYTTAGMFMSTLVAEHGAAKVAAAFAGTAWDAPLEELDVLAEEAFGTPFVPLLEEFDAAPFTLDACPRSRYRDDAPACAIARPLECAARGHDVVIAFDTDLSCQGDASLGPADGLLWQEYRLSLAAVPYVVRLRQIDGPPPIDVTLQSCSAGCASTGDDRVHPMERDDATDEWKVEIWHPGVYLLRLTATAETATTVSTTFEVGGVCRD